MVPTPFSPSRRRLLELGTGALVAGTTATSAAPPESAAQAGVVRVASVSTDVEGGLLPVLLESFKAETGVDFSIGHGNDPYGAAERGEADLVISHFGHRDTERFVTQGLGLWPRTVFSNQAALFGPAADPAGVRATTSLVEAFRRIAGSGAAYLLNDNAGIRYLSDIVWHAAGRPAKGAWFIDAGNRKGDALAQAAQQGAYMLWGLTPFQREQTARPSALVPLLTADPLLQRIMVAVAVNPARLPGVNAPGARRLQDYLLSPAVQARILTTPYAGVAQALWAPAGRHNAGAVLPG